jgi:hypothetical protein
LFATVASAEDDPITKYIASLPWHGSYVTSPQGKDNPDFIITISYKREDVISDNAIIPLKLYLLSIPRSGIPRSFKCRESFGGLWGTWCNGTANVVEAKQDGFKIELQLTWGGVDIPKETFEESFGCVWKTQQKFATNGFNIIVETAKYNAEPTNAPYSSPAAGSKR